MYEAKPTRQSNNVQLSFFAQKKSISYFRALLVIFLRIPQTQIGAKLMKFRTHPIKTSANMRQCEWG